MTPEFTSQGIAAAVAAYGVNQSVAITHMALGDEAYAITPEWDETDIRGRREVAQISGGGDNGDRTATLSALFDNANMTGAAYNAGVAGFYLGDPDDGGVLLAIWSAPGAVIAHRDSAAQANFVGSWTLDLNAVPAGSVTVVVDPSSGFDVAVIRQHVTPGIYPHPHSQYVLHTQDQGLTQEEKERARLNIDAEAAGAAGQAVAAHEAKTANAHSAASVGADPAGTAAQAVSAHEAKTANAHTAASVGAEPAGAVEEHSATAPHFSEIAIQQIVATAVSQAMAAEAKKSRPIGMLFDHFDSTPPAGASALNGAILNRADKPELWAWVNARPHLLVTEAEWNEAPINRNNKIKFSSGNESSTFRMPLADGLFRRAADTGSGLVPGGLFVGQWFDEMIKLHGHPYMTAGGNGDGDGNGALATDNNTDVGPKVVHPPYTGYPSDATGNQANLIGGFGGEETRPAGFGVLICIWDGSS